MGLAGICVTGERAGLTGKRWIACGCKRGMRREVGGEREGERGRVLGSGETGGRGVVTRESTTIDVTNAPLCQCSDNAP